MTPQAAMICAQRHTNCEGGAGWLDGLGFREARLNGHVVALDDIDDKRYLILPVCCPWSGKLVDVIALDPAQPPDTHFLTGCGRLLGNTLFRYGHIRLHRDVWAWLHSPDDLCAIDLSVLPELFTGKPRLTLECDNYAHAIEVLTAFHGVEGVVPRFVYDDETRLAA
jgi:hypothetical protein